MCFLFLLTFYFVETIKIAQNSLYQKKSKHSRRKKYEVVVSSAISFRP